MFWLAVVFLALAVVAVGLGFKGVGIATAVVAQVFFVAFAVWTVTSFLSEYARERRRPRP
jgi:uncharacterized membrane protein YtjA (UPF0391 family)